MTVSFQLHKLSLMQQKFFHDDVHLTAVQIGFTLVKFNMSENNETVNIEVFKQGQASIILTVNITANYNTTGIIFQCI